MSKQINLQAVSPVSQDGFSEVSFWAVLWSCVIGVAYLVGHGLSQLEAPRLLNWILAGGAGFGTFFAVLSFLTSQRGKEVLHKYRHGITLLVAFGVGCFFQALMDN